jgi:hypothetical protein
MDSTKSNETLAEEMLSPSPPQNKPPIEVKKGMEVCELSID